MHPETPTHDRGNDPQGAMPTSILPPPPPLAHHDLGGQRRALTIRARSCSSLARQPRTPPYTSPIVCEPAGRPLRRVHRHFSDGGTRSMLVAACPLSALAGVRPDITGVQPMPADGGGTWDGACRDRGACRAGLRGTAVCYHLGSPRLPKGPCPRTPMVTRVSGA